MKSLFGPAAPRGGLLGGTGSGGGGRPKGRPRAVLALSGALNLALFAALAVLLLRSGPGEGAAPVGDPEELAAQLSRTQALLASVQEQAQALTTKVTDTRASLLQQQQQRRRSGGGAAGGGGAAPLLGDSRRWLTIGIPTVPRRGAGGANATTYLTATLESLMEELPADPSGGSQGLKHLSRGWPEMHSAAWLCLSPRRKGRDLGTRV